MKKQKYNYILFALLAFFYSCTCTNCLKDSYDFEMPEKIKNSAERYIINKTGLQFFNNNIFPDYINTKKVGSNYELHYILIIPNKDFVKEPIFFTVDSLGKVLEQYEMMGIPNVADVPTEGEYNITEEQAVEIAKENNLAKGMKDWKVSFMWSSEYDKYIWEVMSIISETHYGENNYKAKGEEIIIDPYDGKVILQRKWDIK